MKNIFVKIITFLVISIFIFSISGVVFADTSDKTQTSGGHETPTTAKPPTTETKPVASTTSTSKHNITSTSEILNTTTTAPSSETTTSKYETDYELSQLDKTLLVSPAVCYVSTLWTARVFDDNVLGWSKPYTFGPIGGTGFVVNPLTGHIVTAAHVIDAPYREIKKNILDQYIKETYPEDYDTLSESDWDTIDSYFKVEGLNDIAPDREVWVQFNTATAGIADSSDENYITAELISISDVNNRDMGIIQVTPKTGRALSAAIIGDSSLLEILDPITIIGYPWTSDIGQDNVLNPTIISGILSGRVLLNGAEIMQVQGDARPGNSGGPVLNAKGEVIGIVTMGTDSTNNYLRPGNDVKIFLGKIKNETGLVDEEWKTGLIMYREQHYVEAMKHFNAVLNLSNGHILAQEYKTKAQSRIADDIPLAAETTVSKIESTTTLASVSKAEEKQVSFKNSKMLLVIIFSGGFVLLAGLIFCIIFILRRKNKKSNIKKSFVVTSGPQPSITIEVLKASKQEKTVNGIKVKFCTNCGLKVDDNQVFCPNCGARLK